MRGLSIRARLAFTYLAVLGAATLALTGAAWWLMRASMQSTADAALADRVEGTRRFIVAAIHGLPKEELQDEFQEFAELTRGEALLEVTDDTGRTLCRPSLPEWETLHVSPSPPGELRVEASAIAGKPYRAIATSIELEGHAYRLTAALPMALEYAALRRFGWLLAALVPAVMLIAGAGGFWLSGRALAPVDRMTRDVQLISVRDPSRRLDVPGAGDELTRLAETFNDMLARWQQAFADMVRFTADASHELRTPVSLARTTAELALSRPRTNEAYQAALAEVLGQTERMTLLVNDLLSLARADAGVEPAPVTPVDLSALFREIVRELEPGAHRAGIDLEVSLPPGPAAIPGSRESLRRLFVILLENAVRYTPPGGSIRLSLFPVQPRSDSVSIEILDTGPGITSEDLPRVFDRFYRGSAAREVAPDGAGLGLSIAKTIVERHGGRITISTPASGRGCHVNVVLPQQC